MTDSKVERVYYTADTMLRYNPLWCIICGERSVGKSFEFKKRSINTPNTIWVYLRRTDVLRKDPRNWKTYISDLLQANVIDENAEYKVSAEGVWVDGVQKVIFSALSTDSTAHSMTFLPDDMQKVKTKKAIDDLKKPKKKKEEIENLSEEDKEKLIEKIEDAEVTFNTDEKIKKKIIFEEMLEPTGRYLKNEMEILKLKN